MSKPTFKLKKTKSNCLLTAEGTLGIQQAKDFKRALANAMENKTHVLVDLKGVSSLDVSAAQILFALKKADERAEQSVTITLPTSLEVNDLLNKTGIIKLL